MYIWADATLNLKYISYYIGCGQKHLKATAQETFLAHVHKETFTEIFTVVPCISKN